METPRQADARPGCARRSGFLSCLSPAVLAVWAAAAILFAIPAAKPFYLDNMDFPAVAKATAETGLPVYYRGEENPHHLGLYHPPLYIYALAAWFRVLGFGEAQARLFGLVCLFLHGWVVLCLLRLFLGKEVQRTTAPWFWGLFLLNPYTLQGAAVLDIDTTVYGPLLAGLVAAALRINWSDGQPRQDGLRMSGLCLIALLTALAFWAKLTTSLSVIPVVLLLLARGQGWRNALIRGGGAVLAGVLIFLATYAIYGRITGLDITFSFRFLLFSLHQRSGSGNGVEWLASHWRTFRDMARWQILWTGMLPWAVSGATLLWLAWKSWRERTRKAVDMLIVLAWALFVTGFYCGLTYTFGGAPFKYVYIAWGIVCVVFSAWAARAWERLQEQTGIRMGRWAGWLFAGFCLLVSAEYLQDRTILTGQISSPDLALMLSPAALALAGILCWRHLKGPWLYYSGALAYVGAMSGLALAMTRAPYPTTYDYGQLGFDDTVCFIRAHTEPGDAILSMKDVGFRAGRRYFENYGYVFGGPPAAEAARKLLAEGKARYAVFTEGNGPDYLGLNPALQDVIHTLCVLERSYGHYRIYDCGGAARRAADSPH
jgi:hypothetical protein